MSAISIVNMAASLAGNGYLLLQAYWFRVAATRKKHLRKRSNVQRSLKHRPENNEDVEK